MPLPQLNVPRHYRTTRALVPLSGETDPSQATDLAGAPLVYAAPGGAP